VTGGLLDRLGVELPLVQAGMGGGVAGPELAAAVSEAGGLGTLGLSQPDAMRSGLRAARERTRKPLAVNLLLPFVRGPHWEAAADADLVVTFWGRPVRMTDRPWLHQCGSVEEARAAHVAGADGVIAQGVEAGGHVRGVVRALDLLERIRVELPGIPVLVAGGLATADDVQRALDAGAEAAVLGTRFLLARESAAHPGYKRRVLAARETMLTDLFALGWSSAPHRVVANGATERWCGRDGRAPGWAAAAGRLAGPLAPWVAGRGLTALQRPWLPLFSPEPPLEGAPERLLDAAPLYAGDSALRIDGLADAGPLVRELAGA
jgi:NAD(P)H-dependent flavin oxidoreductase YrpB (nitropropane dioxygenase family)